jgi:hypothetical protein
MGIQQSEGIGPTLIEKGIIAELRSSWKRQMQKNIRIAPG